MIAALSGIELVADLFEIFASQRPINDDKLTSVNGGIDCTIHHSSLVG